MEILIALFIFSFAALYVSRTIRHLLKRQKKVEREVKDSRSHSNILETLRQDLRGIQIHFDMNLHLNQWGHSVLLEAEEETEGREEKIPFEGRNFMNPQFDFFGEENQLTFTTLIPFSGDRESERLVKVSYFLKQCTDRETGETGSCLIRGVSHHWKDRRDLEHQKNRVLIRGLKDITFSYYHPEKKEWERTWDFLSLWKQGETRPGQRMVLLPLSVQINMEREKNSSSHVFSVSHPFLHTFRPGNLSPLVYLSTSKPSTTPPSPDKGKDKDDSASPSEQTLSPARTTPPADLGSVPSSRLAFPTGFRTHQPNQPRSSPPPIQ